MRENRTYGSEGGEAIAFPTPSGGNATNARGSIDAGRYDSIECP